MKIAFYKKGGNWFDKAIRWWTLGPYSHVELIDKEGNLYSASSNHNVVRVARFRLKPEHWDIYELKDINEKATISFMNSQLNKKYDWSGIFLSQLIPLNIQNPNRWFCSELCYAALVQGGILGKYKAYNVHPNKLFKFLIKKSYIT